MQRTITQNAVPKSELIGTPGACGPNATMNRATRRAINRALQAARNGDAQTAAQILASVQGINAGDLDANAAMNIKACADRANTANTTNTTNTTQRQPSASVAGTLNQGQIARLYQDIGGLDACRATGVALSVLLNALKDEDLTSLTATDILGLVNGAAATGALFVSVTRPLLSQTNQNQTNQNQTNQNQTNQNRRTSRRSRQRDRQPVTV